ncbi:MAG: hypothetical protein WAV51_02490 [Microgenomates group bacterium]
MEIKMFYYLKEKNAKPLQTDVLVIPFGSNARSLALLAPTSEWVRENKAYAHLISSDEVVKKSATFVDSTPVAKFTFFIKHLSGSSIHALVTTCLEFAIEKNCAMIDMPLFTANGFKAMDDRVIMKTMIKACNEFAKKHEHDAASLEISFILDTTQQDLAVFCASKGIQYSGRQEQGQFKR